MLRRGLEEVFNSDEVHRHPQASALGIMSGNRREDGAVLVDRALLGAFLDRATQQSGPCGPRGDCRS